ncbi:MULTISPECIES: 6-phosphofructokinase [unclassified Nitratiruptor]|uniref:6-phosphofructokinase n=1 Tax=unclassified Nitratiruptor TaxID=2624044 RepID=UPI001916BB7A|nr:MULTISPECIES: 6-phosphofructokinase [unclassified Nitratiruptor]BCD60387.1 6-phosphofructokinase 1 [Nitratiruptor sp. YY08-10]BCD64124.1 6-phosphofructokinase 1 [Nitratiruptor sp. YY08-14]
MKIAIMGSGGDAPGMNPAIKRFVEAGYEMGHEPYFIFDGLEGLIDGKIRKASYKDVAGIIHRGGAIIGSSRSKRWYEKKYRKKAYENLKEEGIDAIVVMGGDGSFRALDLFKKEFAINFVGIPTTIDNDIHGTDLCLGVDTALNVIRDAIDKIRDTASTFSRAFVVETMGRECGYLAAVSAITSGAEVCVIPEVEFDKPLATKILKKELQGGRRYILAIVAEGTKRTAEIAQWLEDDIGMETRVTVLGHIQRGGNPTVKDRLLGSGFALRALETLDAGKEGKVVVYRDGDFKIESLEDALKPYEIDPEILSLLHFLD